MRRSERLDGDVGRVREHLRRRARSDAGSDDADDRLRYEDRRPHRGADDPVDLLFGTQLGGGTDINLALGYCQQIITRPLQTILVLITDLYEGGNGPEMLKRGSALVQSGVNVVCLLALNDQGAPAYDQTNAAAFASFGVPTFACSPDLFPDLMASAIQRRDLSAWAARNDIVTARSR